MAENSFNATVQYAGNHYFIGTPPSGHAMLMEANHERGSGTTPMEMLLVAVAGCTAYDVQSILEKKRQDVTDYRVEISGERREEHPRSITKLHVKHIVKGRGISEKALADAIDLSETKYCSVGATVKPTAEITTSYEIVEEPAA